jgi:hypothetical protein
MRLLLLLPSCRHGDGIRLLIVKDRHEPRVLDGSHATVTTLVVLPRRTTGLTASDRARASGPVRVTSKGVALVEPWEIIVNHQGY